MRILFFVLLAVLLVACAGGGGVPSGIIPAARMETIVWQLMQSDEYVNTVLARDSAKRNATERMKMYKQVFDLNKTSVEEFKKSYAYYMAHPDIAKTMFDSISAKAGRQSEALRAVIYKPKAVLDSVAKPVQVPVPVSLQNPVKFAKPGKSGKPVTGQPVKSLWHPW